jgi:hypothetical protein
MKIILTLIYPVVSDPLSPIDSLDTFHNLLRTSTKYCFELATDRLSKHLLSRVESRPEEALWLFASASVVGLDDLKSKLSRFCLRRSLEDLFQRDATYLKPTPEIAPTPRSPTERVFYEGPIVIAGLVRSPPSSPRTRTPAPSGPGMNEVDYLPIGRRLHSIFDPASATEICRLMALYTWRMSKVKAIIERYEHGRGTTCHQCRQPLHWNRFLDAAKLELEAAGPVSGRIFTTDFLISSINSGACAQCCKGLLVDWRSNMQAMEIEFNLLRDTV